MVDCFWLVELSACAVGPDVLHLHIVDWGRVHGGPTGAEAEVYQQVIGLVHDGWRRTLKGDFPIEVKRHSLCCPEHPVCMKVVSGKVDHVVAHCRSGFV